MFFVSWKGLHKVSTVCCPTREEVFDLTNLLENAKIKYKVVSRMGITLPSHLGYGDMNHWLTDIQEPLY